MRGFVKLKARIERAEAEMEKALERAFPIGTRIRCWIMYGQVTPSTGEVIAYTGGRHAYLRVRLNSRTQEVRDVPVENVF
jgi:hypothetical protein